jgi:hypothetical protein
MILSPKSVVFAVVVGVATVLVLVLVAAIVIVPTTY